MLARILFTACICITSSNVIAELWYEVPIKWNMQLPAPVDMSQRSLDAPAGKHGYINVVGDRLEFDDGTPARFWGVVMAVSTSMSDGSLPPSRKDAVTVAKKIASYGFNHVRFVGFDGHAPQALKNWKKTGVIKSGQIEKLDYFIHVLRSLGIYYSFSINNSSAELLKNEAHILANDAKKYAYRKYRNVRMYDHDAKSLMIEWAKAFYSRKNPYTGISYAKDPANIYISSVNEDTANIVRFNKGRTLSKPWIDRINGMFNDFLRDKYRDKNEFETSWDNGVLPVLIPGESYDEKNIDMFTRLTHSALPSQRLIDMQEFITKQDLSYAENMREMLHSIGYRGLFTGTNKWYGLGSLYSNYQAGNYINGHDYFDGISDLKRENGDIASTRILNRDYLSLMANSPDETLDDTRFAINRILPAHLNDRPYITSEWNHVIWSDYAYQGAYIISSYAALNGIDGLDVHRMYNHPRSSYKDEYPRNLLAVSMNPLMMAILPSISLAYLRGDIEEFKQKIVYCYADDIDALKQIWHWKPRIPKELKKLYKESPFGSVRVSILEGCNIGHTEKQHIRAMQGVTINAQADDVASMDINTEKYVARVGYLGLRSRVAPLRVNLQHSGAVSLISLDDKPLESTECALLTVAGPTRNTGMTYERKNDGKYLTGLGKAPPLLMANSGHIEIDLMKGREYSVVPVRVNNATDKIRVNISEGGLRLELNNQQTPWYVITSNNCNTGKKTSNNNM